MQQKPTIPDFTNIFSQKKPQPILQLKKYGILALLTELDGELHFILTKRAAHVRQPGDICFPGGHQEKGEDLKQTALREIEEELGMPIDQIRILGKSNYMLTVYGGLIQPYIGIVSAQDYHSISCQLEEVAEVFTIPLAFFLEHPPEIHYMYWKADMSVPFPYDRIENGKSYGFRECKVPELFYFYEGKTIWGLTAQIIENIISEWKTYKASLSSPK